MGFTLKQLKLRQNRQRAGDVLEARLGRRAQQRDVMTFIKLNRAGQNTDSFIQELQKKYQGLRVRKPQKYVPKQQTRKVKRNVTQLPQPEIPRPAPRSAPKPAPKSVTRTAPKPAPKSVTRTATRPVSRPVPRPAPIPALTIPPIPVPRPVLPQSEIAQNQ